MVTWCAALCERPVGGAWPGQTGWQDSAWRHSAAEAARTAGEPAAGAVAPVGRVSEHGRADWQGFRARARSQQQKRSSGIPLPRTAEPAQTGVARGRAAITRRNPQNRDITRYVTGRRGPHSARAPYDIWFTRHAQRSGKFQYRHSGPESPLRNKQKQRRGSGSIQLP